MFGGGTRFQMDFQGKFEEFKVHAGELVDKVQQLIREGNVRRIIVKDTSGHTFMEIPLNIAAIGVVAVPLLAALGALAALVAYFTIITERVPEPPAPPPAEPAEAEEPAPAETAETAPPDAD